MSWQQLQLTLGHWDGAQVEHTLETLGALAITFKDAADDAIFEPPPGEQPLWRNSRVRALFADDIDLAPIQAQLIADCGDNPQANFQIIPLADQTWETKWKDDYHAMCFGERLWVGPDDTPPPQDKAAILLNPGLAFGTGTHPTTALCLEWLSAQTLDQKTLIDYGCGSGILAIAAAKLGAHCTAIDNEHQAVTATQYNAQHNDVGARIHARLADDTPPKAADIVVANILARALTTLAPALAHCTRLGGQIALSGLLETQADTLADIYQPWFDLNPPITRDGWVLLTGTRRAQ